MHTRCYPKILAREFWLTSETTANIRVFRFVAEILRGKGYDED
jgi:hypothetical protein